MIFSGQLVSCTRIPIGRSMAFSTSTLYAALQARKFWKTRSLTCFSYWKIAMYVASEAQKLKSMSSVLQGCTHRAKHGTFENTVYAAPQARFFLKTGSPNMISNCKNTTYAAPQARKKWKLGTAIWFPYWKSQCMLRRRREIFENRAPLEVIFQ